MSSNAPPRGTGLVIMLIGFVGGFFIMGGIYGFIFPEQLVAVGLGSITQAYLVSGGLVLNGFLGLYLQRYVRQKLASG